MRKLLVCLLLIFLPAPAWAALPGPMKDFFTARPGETTAVVFGTRGLEKGLLSRIELLAVRNADYLKQRDPSRVVEVYADTAFPAVLQNRRSLVLMGSTRSNKLIQEWREFLPFLIRDGRLNVAGRKLYYGDDVSFSFILPNPLANGFYIFGLVGIAPWAQPSLEDGDGRYDYWIGQRHDFPGRYLNRGKFEKNSSPWSHTPAEYEQAPFDTISLFSLTYPYGRIWYPFHWERDTLWKDPAGERITLLSNVHRLFKPLIEKLGLSVWWPVDFHLSEIYPGKLANDLFGRVFVQTLPGQIDSSTVYQWGRAVSRNLIPSRDGVLDWELFCQRYLLFDEFFSGGSAPRLPRDSRGREWLFGVTEGDSTYLAFLRWVDGRYHTDKIGMALDSVMQGGRRYTFDMKEFIAVVTRLAGDTALTRLSKVKWIPSPYGRHPVFDLGIKGPGALFTQEEVIAGDLTYGGKAYAAGLRKGDKILSVDGFPTERNRSRAYLAWLGKKKGETLKLEIKRKGAKHTVLVPVG